MEIRERICKLCLQICGQNFQEIVDNMKYVLEILLLKINFTVVEEPVMCEQCTEMVIKCFDFKAKCLDTHDYMVPFITNKDLNKLDLKDVYVIKNVSCAGVPEDYKVCGFCMSLVNDCSTVSFDVEEEGIRLEEMIKLCLPELDFSLIKKPVSCSPCYESLKNSFYFLVNCLNVEEKIQQYCAPLCTIGKDMVDHRNFILIARDTKDEVDDNPNDLNKVEIQFCQERENLRREIGNQGDADGDIKNKNGSFIEQANVFVYEKYSDTFGTINKEENLCAMEDQACLLHEELQIKADNHEFNRYNWLKIINMDKRIIRVTTQTPKSFTENPVPLCFRIKINGFDEFSDVVQNSTFQIFAVTETGLDENGDLRREGKQRWCNSPFILYSV